MRDTSCLTDLFAAYSETLRGRGYQVRLAALPLWRECHWRLSGYLASRAVPHAADTARAGGELTLNSRR